MNAQTIWAEHFLEIRLYERIIDDQDMQSAHEKKVLDWTIQRLRMAKITKDESRAAFLWMSDRTIRELALVVGTFDE